MVFGDVYLTWNRAGVYLATIAMDYYDPELLAIGETVPLGEVFHLDWGIDAGAGPQRFVLYIVPPKAFPKDGTVHTRAHLCRITQGTCEPVPGTTAHYLGSDTPRIVAEVALPWRALGVEGPPPAGQLRMELAATSYHRARWMSWSGLPAGGGPARDNRVAYSTTGQPLGDRWEPTDAQERGSPTGHCCPRGPVESSAV